MYKFSGFRPSPARGRSIGACALALLTAAVLVPAGPAGADDLISESFTGSSVTNTGWVTGGAGGAVAGWPGGACLTAGTDTSAAVPGCGLNAPDADGSGALRLTAASGSLTGFGLYNTALPTRFGIDVTFKVAEWGGYGGGGADGLSMFFVKGSTNLVTAGYAGGNLGYRGVTNGLLGIGFDSFGNFSSDSVQGVSCPPAPGFTRDQIGVRGPGSGQDGFCWITGTGELDEYLASDGDREDATIEVHVVIDPETVSDRKVTVTFNRTTDPISGELVFDLPEEFANEATFKFGFAGSTGSEVNFHEVWDVQVASINPVVPDTVPPGPGPGPAPTPGPDTPTTDPAAVVPRYTG